MAGIILPACFSVVSAQSIRGTISDKANKPLQGAGIRVLTLDSVFISGTASDEQGNFLITGIKPGNLLIRISYLGYGDLFLHRQMSDQPINLGKLVLREGSSSIGEVTVTEQANTARQKGDTTEYNAGSYKTNPDATAEDLITKMPGVTSENGKLKAQGEDVKQVLVDGKPFFGDDPSAVLKNLPADVIDKIQVFDKKSDQSQLTGFDDGNTSKTLNIITKAQFKNGTFGKAYAGYGYEEKWKAGYSLNFFKDKRRISLLANLNNINEQNFTQEDLLGVMSSSQNNSGAPQGQGNFRPREGGNRSGGRQGGNSDAGNFLVDQSNGITTTKAFGMNYSNSWKRLDITGSYFLNFTNNHSLSNLYRQFISAETRGLTYAEENNAFSKNVNQRFNLRFDWKPNPKNSFLLQPKVSFQHNDGLSEMLGINSLLNSRLSSVSNHYSTLLDGMNISFPIQYKHSFQKKGRAFSMNLIPTYTANTGHSDLNYYSGNADTLATDTISQTAHLDKKGFGGNATLSFSEPLNAKSQILFSYSAGFNNTDSKKNTFDNYLKEQDTSLSNTFKSLYTTHSLGLTYRYQIEKWNLTAGFAVQRADLNNDQIYPATYALNKTFYSALPNLSFQRKYTAQKNLRINYSSSNNAPTADQLQEVINNKNPLLLTTGNAGLKQDWQNNLNLRYTSVNTKKNTAFFFLLGSTLTQNYVVKSTLIAATDTFIQPSVLLKRGSQITRPVNLDGFYNLRSFLNYTLPMSRLKSKVNLNISLNQTRTPSLINGELNYSGSSSMNLGLSITSSISEKLDFTLSSNSGYNQISNSLQTSLNSTYFNQSSRFKIQVNPWKGLVLQTEANHQYYSGLSSSYNQNYLLWNAAIGYKFLKDKVADLRFSVFDVLKQNNSISRNTGETYYEDVQTTVLQRYFMLTFTYNLKFFKEKKSSAPEPQ